MSQVTERKNAVGIQGLSWRECQKDIISLMSAEQVSTVQAIIPEILKGCSPTVASVVNPLISKTESKNDRVLLLSSDTLQKAFAKPFTTRVNQFTALGLEKVEAKRAAVICSLSEMNFVVTNPARAKERLYTAFSEKTGADTDRALKTLFHELNSGHTKVFTTTLASLFAKASVVSGFPNVTIKPLPRSEGVLVIAKNQSGQGLVSEISVNKMQQVNTTTEVVGIHDGSCEGVIKRFNAEIKRLGVKFSSDSTRPTRGTVQHGANLAEKKKHELERTRKLNQQRRAQH